MKDWRWSSVVSAFHSSKTEYDKRPAPRPKLVVSTRKLDEQRGQRTVLSSKCGEDIENTTPC
jgi:hypothetical protein